MLRKLVFTQVTRYDSDVFSSCSVTRPRRAAKRSRWFHHGCSAWPSTSSSRLSNSSRDTWPVQRLFLVGAPSSPMVTQRPSSVLKLRHHPPRSGDAAEECRDGVRGVDPLAVMTPVMPPPGGLDHSENVFDWIEIWRVGGYIHRGIFLCGECLPHRPGFVDGRVVHYDHCACRKWKRPDKSGKTMTGLRCVFQRGDVTETSGYGDRGRDPFPRVFFASNP